MFHSDKTRFGSVLIGLICLMLHPELQAQIQVYPVSVTTRLTPPYSVNLSDYAAPGCEQLKVIILQRDLTQAPYMLYLRMEIELNGKVIIRTSPQFLPPALTIEPGIPTVISGTDLAIFFDPANMEFTGYSREAYIRSKILPEGAYVISFTAYDYTRRDVALSRGGSMFCYLAKTDPPRLNLPVNNALVRFTQPQILSFQWLPGNTSSPNSAFSMGYLFELYEMRVGGYPPADIVQNTRPIFSCETDRTTLYYGMDNPVLEKGMRYVWRVKAFDRTGSDHIRNNGYSEVFCFLYDDASGSEGPVNFNAINNFTAEALSPQKAKLSWENSPEYISYKIYYRSKDKGGRWYEAETGSNEAEVKGLIPGQIYECRVQGRRGNAWGSFSETDTVLMPFPAVIQCGSPFEPLNISNREPLFQLTKMQQFDAGGFMVTLIDPYAVSFSPGRFSGRGFVQVPLFGHKKILCDFTDVFINTDFQMVEGAVRLLKDDKNNLLTNVDDVFEGGSDNGRVKEGTEQIGIVLPDVKIDRAEQIILGSKGKELLVVQQGDTIHIDITEQVKGNTGALTLKDENGTIYSVDTRTGKVTDVGRAMPAGKIAGGFPATIDSKAGTVTFENAVGTRFAFDKRDKDYNKANLFQEEYETIKLSDGGDYDVPIKLIPVGETDIVQAVFDIRDKSIEADSVMFVSGNGTVYKANQADKKGEKFILTLPSGKESDGLEIFAVANDKSHNRVLLGKLTVVSYSVKRPKLMLVPVNGNSKTIDIAQLKSDLDKIYTPVAVDWEVKIDDSNFDFDETSIDFTGSGLFSQYTEGMRNLNNSYITHMGGSLPDETAIYLFMLKKADGNITGDMPRSKQFGYIFTETAAKVKDGLIRTIAHEISHGAFHLNHTFDNQYRIPEKSTKNLMDYTDGTTLVKHQWDAIHDPGLVIGMFERDEEGMGIFSGKFTLLDEKHTLLLNLVYDNNNKGSLKYLEKIEKSRLGSKVDALDLDYTGKKESDWIKSWKLRTETSEKIVTAVINKIQDAGRGEKIKKLSLSEKGIYIGKFTVNEIEYPVAIYSRKNSIDNLIKVQVNEIDDLDSAENKKYLRSEETHFKYLIIAFYEDGETEPSLIMQIEKFDVSKWQDTKEEWLRYLNIIENNQKNQREIVSDTLFSIQKLKQLYPKVDETVIKDIFSYIFQYKNEYGIDDCTSLIHFLTQADHESGGFRYMKEIGTFTGQREKYKGRGIFQVTWEANYKSFQNHLASRGINVDLVKNPELLEETKYAVLSALWYWQKNNLSSYAIDLKTSTALKVSKLVNCGNINFCGCEKDNSNNCKKDEKGASIKCYDCAPNGWDDRKSKFEKYKNQIKCE